MGSLTMPLVYDCQDLASILKHLASTNFHQISVSSQKLPKAVIFKLKSLNYPLVDDEIHLVDHNQR